MAFIYVCTADDRDKLLEYGFQLISSNEKTSLWVFKNDEDILKDVGKIVDVFAYGNTLVF